MRVGIHNSFYVKQVYGEDDPMEVAVDMHHIEAVDEDGHVWALEGSDTEDRAFAEFELWHLDHDPASEPNLWVECAPVYGSNAWDDEAEYELACHEADCFNEPRPRW